MNVMLLAGLIYREPLPMVNYINGMGLRSVVLQGDETKKSSYRFVSRLLEVGSVLTAVRFAVFFLFCLWSSPAFFIASMTELSSIRA